MQPSSTPTSAGFDVGIFQVVAYRTSNAHSVNISSLAQAFHGGIAVSGAKVFVAGENQILGLPKTNLSTSSPLATLHSGNFSLVSNLATQQMYALVDGSFNFLVGPGSVSNLMPLDQNSGTYVSGKVVSLALSITLDFGSGIFSGWTRIVFVDGSTLTAYNVDPLDGMVQTLTPALQRWEIGAGWAAWGIAE